jgi:hypothetical protein
MSSQNFNRPRLVCRLTRLRASLTAHPASGVREHRASCADCRNYFATAEQWDGHLQREAAPVRETASESLESRILHAVTRSQAQERRTPRGLSWGMAGLAAVAIATIVILRTPEPPPTAAPQMASIQDVLVVADELPRQWLATLEPGAVKLLEENPLQTEIASVGSDARSALNFLAMNFLPSNRDLAPQTERVSRPRGSS